MGRSRYAVSIGEEILLGCKIYEPTHPHFLTCTVLHWLPIFTNQESVQIILDSLAHLQKSDNMLIFSCVILENHLHLVASSDDISKTMQKFKSYTAYELLKLLEKNNATTLLKQFFWITRGREIMVSLSTDMHSTAGAVERDKKTIVGSYLSIGQNDCYRVFIFGFFD